MTINIETLRFEIQLNKLDNSQMVLSPLVVGELLDRLEAAEKERGTLRAKIEQMEKQRPVASIYIDGKGEREFDDWKCDLPTGRSLLYALPGAQSKLDEIRTALQRAIELGQRETWTGARKHRSHEDQREEQQCWNKVWSLLGAQGEEK